MALGAALAQADPQGESARPRHGELLCVARGEQTGHERSAAARRFSPTIVAVASTDGRDSELSPWTTGRTVNDTPRFFRTSRALWMWAMKLQSQERM